MPMSDFVELQKRATAQWEQVVHGARPVIFVGMASCGINLGAREVKAAIEAELQQRHLDVEVRQTGCMGPCYMEPLVDILKPGRPRLSYGHVTPELVPELIESYLVRDDPRPDLAFAAFDPEFEDRSTEGYQGIPAAKELPFFRKQQRIILRNSGYIDPENIEDYIARGGYQALAKALFEMTPEAVIEEVKVSNVRGRGGAGFPCGIKWEGARKTQNSPKYMVCNAHEGEPNVFKDRRIMEGDPHMVIEGILLGCYALGTSHGYAYIGGEYPLAVRRMEAAVEEARRFGLLGDNILGSGFSANIDVYAGAGGYINGEASALMYAIEGKRGQPRTKPPRSVEAGLWMKPTSVNNVETLANIPQILINGGQWFAGIGTAKSTGTKVFSLAGTINNIGIIELPLGTTLEDLIMEAGGGIPNGHAFKAVQTGGPSGGCLPIEHLNVPLDFESMGKIGGLMGSGGFIIVDDTVCMVDLGWYFTRFNRGESCGKCTPCRIGTKAHLEILNRIVNGQGREEDIDLLVSSGHQIVELSLCGLGQTAPLPVLGGIKYFRDEYEAHVRGYCPTGVCPALKPGPVPVEAGA